MQFIKSLWGKYHKNIFFYFFIYFFILLLYFYIFAFNKFIDLPQEMQKSATYNSTNKANNFIFAHYWNLYALKSQSFFRYQLDNFFAFQFVLLAEIFGEGQLNPTWFILVSTCKLNLSKVNINACRTS